MQSYIQNSSSFSISLTKYFTRMFAYSVTSQKCRYIVCFANFSLLRLALGLLPRKYLGSKPIDAKQIMYSLMFGSEHEKREVVTRCFKPVVIL